MPSENRNAVPRSVGSRMSDIRSTPTTSTLRAAPEETAEAASARPTVKPAQAALTCQPGTETPSRRAISWASRSEESRSDIVATRIWSTSVGAVPASASALPAAVAPISTRVSSGLAKQRVLMPLRRSIHSGLDSRVRQISSLVTIRRGR